MTVDGTSKLKRVLGLWDLTFLGLGVTLGLGTYVLAGSVAKNHAGPAVCVCFLIAAIASALAGKKNLPFQTNLSDSFHQNFHIHICIF